MRTTRGALALTLAIATGCATSGVSKFDRDPASLALVCSNEAVVVEPQTVHDHFDYSQASLEEQYQHVDLMIKKSRLYSAGLFETPDPRLVIVQKAVKEFPQDGTWTERFYKLSPADRPSPAADSVQAKAGDLIFKNRTSEARALLNQTANDKAVPLEIRLAAKLDWLKSYRFQGNDDDFLKQLEASKLWYAKAYFSQSPRTPVATKNYSSYLQAILRAHIKKKRFDQAAGEISDLRNFLAREHASIAGAAWLSGRLSELKGEPEKARASYEAALTQLPSDDVTLEQVQWQLGWMNYKLKAYDRAIEFWAQLPATGAMQVLARNAYWTARATQAQGKDAAKLFHGVVDTYPGTFYAPLAQRELGEAIRPLHLDRSECETAARVLARLAKKYPPEDVKAFATLYRRRDLPNAKLLLMDMSLAHELDSSLLLASSTMGDYQPLILAFSKLPLDEQRELFELFPQLLYPNPFPEAIASESAKSSIDPLFVLSVIRQESVYAPRSLSFADARGLMQVIPPLGEKYASAAGIENYSTARLYEPAINIAIGTRHLKQGLDANHGSYILTLAGYNAGDEITQVWAKHLSKDPVEFIEEIPFQETNGYVKAILRNWIYERALYEKGSQKFPEALLVR